MASIRSTYVNEQRIVGSLDRHDLMRIVSEHVAAQAHIKLDPKRMQVKVIFEDEVEGSPPYTKGTRAHVEIIVNLDPADPETSAQ